MKIKKLRKIAFNQHKVINLLYVLLLAAVVVAIAVYNYVPGTWLSGWDTLHPEFNFQLYLKRIFFGAWQEHQGVGASPAQAHSSELPRLFIYWMLSLFLDTNVIRYAFFFLTLLTGALGFYFFTLKILLKSENSLSSYTVSFVSSLVYLLNMTVVQHYFVPLEMFAVHFAMLPWLVLFLFKYIFSGRTKDLLYFMVTALLFGPSAHTPTLFIVTVGVLFVSLAIYGLGTLPGITNLKRSATAMIFLLAVNLYWILPTAYFIKNHSHDVMASSIHTNFSQEAMLQGMSFGTINDLVLQRNFLFNWYVYDFEAAQYSELLEVWKKHYDEQSGVRVIAYLVFSIAIFGIFAGVIKNNRMLFFVLPIFLAAVVALANDTPYLSALFTEIVSVNNVVKEALRFPFTKFSTLYLFSVSSLFAFGLSFLIVKITEGANQIKIAILGALLLIFMTLPVFEGQLISPAMKVKIPNEYFEMFEWFANEAKPLRIAKLPVYTMYGWGHYSWGYQGAGFTWFGIPQPTLDREFDRWSPYNESFYNEASRALIREKTEPGTFEKVLAKYNVGYLLWDKSLIDTNSINVKIFNENFEEILSQTDNIKKVKDFNDRLVVYETGVEGGMMPRMAESFRLIQANLIYEREDHLFDGQTVYAASQNSAFYPFANFDPRINKSMSINSDYLEFEFASGGQKQAIYTPLYEEKENVVILTTEFDRTGTEEILKLVTKGPQIYVNEQNIYNFAISATPSVIKPKVFPSFINIADSLYRINRNDFSENRKINTVLNLSGDNIEIYTGAAGKQRSLVAGLNSNSPRLCTDPDVVLKKGTAKLLFAVDDEHLCVGDGFKLAERSVFTIKYKYQSSIGKKPDICLSKRNEDNCNKWAAYTVKSLDTSRGEVEIFFVLDAGNYWIDFIGKSEEGERYELLIEDVDIETYKIAETYEVELESSAGSEKIELEDGNIVFKLPLYIQESDNADSFQNTPRATNCSLHETGKVGKRSVADGIFYFAEENGVNCDFFEYNRPRHDIGSLLKISAENLQGRNIKVYLSNHVTNKIELETILNSELTDNYYFIYPSGEGRGYTLNVETRAFGRISSENLLSSVVFIYSPLNWLRNIHIGDIKTIDSSAVIAGNQSNFAGNYNINIEFADDQPALTMLFQGYDKGWRGYKINSELITNNLKLATYFPWFFGEELEHVKVNSWSNGWIINSAEGKVQSAKIVIVYWPQYLQFAGYIILTLSFVAVAVSSLKKRQNWYQEIMENKK
jgi:hypothetical protein